MKINIVDDRVEPFDKFTGLAPNSNGGTENMYRAIVDRHLKVEVPNFKDRFQIICSRVREFEPGKKHIIWLHDMALDPEARHVFHGLTSEMYAAIDAIVFVSWHQYQEYRSYYLSSPGWDACAGKMHVIHNGIIPTSVSHPDVLTNRYVWTPGRSIHCIYHTTPHRGLANVAAIWPDAKAAHPELELDVFSSFSIYGWAERDRQWQRTFDALKGMDGVRLHGAVPNAEVRDVLAVTDFFMYPCTWNETSCIALMEAMAAGAIPITTPSGALIETQAGFGRTFTIDSYKEGFNRTIIDYKAGVDFGRSKMISYANEKWSIERARAEWSRLIEAL